MDYEDILNAMYGDEVVLISDFSKSGEEIDPIRHKFGGNRKVTKGTKRFLSALAMLEVSETTGKIELVVFHNIHTKIPLSPHIAWQIADKQYTLQHGSELYQHWIEINR